MPEPARMSTGPRYLVDQLRSSTLLRPLAMSDAQGCLTDRTLTPAPASESPQRSRHSPAHARTGSARRALPIATPWARPHRVAPPRRPPSRPADRANRGRPAAAGPCPGGSRGPRSTPRSEPPSRAVVARTRGSQRRRSRGRSSVAVFPDAAHRALAVVVDRVILGSPAERAIAAIADVAVVANL